MDKIDLDHFNWVKLKNSKKITREILQDLNDKK